MGGLHEGISVLEVNRGQVWASAGRFCRSKGVRSGQFYSSFRTARHQNQPSLRFCLSGMGPVHMNEVQCSGFEKSITECHFNKDALGCSHEEDAGVRCNVPAMGFQESVSAAPT